MKRVLRVFASYMDFESDHMLFVQLFDCIYSCYQTGNGSFGIGANCMLFAMVCLPDNPVYAMLDMIYQSYTTGLVSTHAYLLDPGRRGGSYVSITAAPWLPVQPEDPFAS
ncbi:unnamed protein product [Amoebophrya sp. A25]|nr:unnamed protein product [Amoebophrya sp. A25]|eukprot:GSA25T00007823001.1